MESTLVQKKERKYYSTAFLDELSAWKRRKRYKREKEKTL
jgi:hypothetical protein